MKGLQKVRTAWICIKDEVSHPFVFRLTYLQMTNWSADSPSISNRSLMVLLKTNAKRCILKLLEVRKYSGCVLSRLNVQIQVFIVQLRLARLKQKPTDH